MTPPRPTRAFLASQIRWARGRGLPAQEAEDVVFEAYQTASATFDPQRGSFEAYMQAVVRNATAYWWRNQGRAARASSHLRLVPTAADSARLERAAEKQQAVLEALSDDERAIFAAWALQKHLGKGQVSAADVGASIGLEPTAFENAKRRLRARLHALLDRFGWSVRDLIHGDDDVDQTG
ncbi:MAG: hypothetical protein H6737_21760 [Alphaproteobacteria bacterium]|nr:hypothetical protein [Alphaproteobacteria bacterium]